MTVEKAKEVKKALATYEDYSYWFEKIEELEALLPVVTYDITIASYNGRVLKLDPKDSAEIFEELKDFYERKMNHALMALKEIG